MTLVATSSRTDFAVSRDVRRAFTRSASRFLPVAGDVVSQATELFGTCSDIVSGLEKRYLSFPVWPWDGQVALLLMGWVMGPGFKLEKFQAAACIYAPDFREMSRQCVFPHRGHTGVMALGDRCRRGFETAADVVSENRNRKKLFNVW